MNRYAAPENRRSVVAEAILRREEPGSGNHFKNARTTSGELVPPEGEGAAGLEQDTA